MDPNRAQAPTPDDIVHPRVAAHAAGPGLRSRTRATARSGRSPLAAKLRRMAALAACLVAPLALGGINREYQLKAAFLYNFTKFVEWHAQEGEGPSAPIVIATLEPNPFGTELERMVRGRKVNGRDVVFALIDEPANERAVHLLFVPAGKEDAFAAARPALEAQGVLTVGETARFGSLGGVITFVTDADKIRFEIDADAASRSRLKISAQLQKLARVVRRTDR